MSSVGISILFRDIRVPSYEGPDLQRLLAVLAPQMRSHRAFLKSSPGTFVRNPCPIEGVGPSWETPS